MTEPDTLPVFPLHAVLLPGGLLPLRIFEARYLDMVSRCLREDSGFVVALIRKGQETGRGAEVHDVGTLARIADWRQGDDGLLEITARGEGRVRLLATEVRPDQLVVGRVRALPAPPPRPLPAEFDSLARLLEKILQEIGPPWSGQTPRLDDAEWVGGRLAEMLPLDMAHKQALLEMDDPLARLFRLRDLMLNLDVI